MICSENVKAMTCDGRKGSSVTHKSNNLKPFVEVEWTASNLKVKSMRLIGLSKCISSTTSTFIVTFG